MKARILYYTINNNKELDRFRDVIINDLRAHIVSTDIERMPTEQKPGIFVIEFITTSEIQHVRTMLSRLGSSFELFDDQGKSTKELIAFARKSRYIPKRVGRRTYTKTK